MRVFLRLLTLCLAVVFAAPSAHAGGDEITCEDYCTDYTTESYDTCMTTLKQKAGCGGGFTECWVPDIGNNKASQYDEGDMTYTCAPVVQKCSVKVEYYAPGCTNQALSSQSAGPSTTASVTLSLPSWSDIKDSGCDTPDKTGTVTGWCTDSGTCYTNGQTISCSNGNSKTISLTTPQYTTCPDGTYAQQGTCLTCTAGSYCTGGNIYSCGAGKWSSAGASSCSTINAGCYGTSGGSACPHSCPSGYPNSTAGSDEITDCYSNTKSRPWTGSQTSCSAPTGCTVTCNTCSNSACSYVAYSNSSGNGDGTVKEGCSTNNASCQQTIKTRTAKSGYWLNGTTCTACPSGYPNSAAGATAITSCYSDSKSRPWSGSQVNGSVPTNCSKVTEWNACSNPACSYVAYSNTAGNGDGTVMSGCSTNNASCTKTVKAVAANSGYYDAGTTCSACPSGYPYSTTDNEGGITKCYSGTKKRAMTSCTQNACSNPDTTGCSSYTCASSCSCTGATCDYTAYSNSAGTGDGTVKTGCSTNAQSCTKAVASLSAKSNYYVNGTSSCPSCGSSYPYSDGGNISSSYCYKNATKYGSQLDPTMQTGCTERTLSACTVGSCTYRDYNGATDGTCTPTNCTKGQTCTSAATNYYLSNGVPKTCSSYSSSYPSSAGGNISYTSCYGSFTKTGSQNDCSAPANSSSHTCASCTPGTCTYSKYASGTIKDDCSATSCNQSVASVTCKANFYKDGTSCKSCPSSHPYSDAGTTSINSCYNTNCKTYCSGRMYYSGTNACTCPDCIVKVEYWAPGCKEKLASEQSKNEYNAHLTLSNAPSWEVVKDSGCDVDKEKAMTAWCDSDGNCFNNGDTAQCYGNTDKTYELYPSYDKCPDGKYAYHGVCETCPAGSYCKDGDIADCGPGKWSVAGASSCQSISAGCYGTNADSACPAKCTAGTYSTGGAATCSSVSAGCWGAEKATTACPNECVAGTWSDGGDASCSPISAGCYGGAKSTSSCPNKCKAGTYRSSTGGTSQSSCSNVDAGCWGAAGATKSCPSSCSTGTYSTGGAASCTNCPAGTYGDTTGLKTEACSGSCSSISFTDSQSGVSCTIANGSGALTRTRTCYYSTSQAGSDSKSDCTGSQNCTNWANGTCLVTSCNTGYAANATNTACEPKTYTCQPGRYLDGTGCSRCPENSYCPGGTWTYNGGIQGLNSCPTDYPYADVDEEGEANTSIDSCYNTDCGTSCTGKDYYGEPDTCNCPRCTIKVEYYAYGCENKEPMPEYIQTKTGYYAKLNLAFPDVEEIFELACDAQPEG
ncbi:MAG: hypothetical protein IKW57_01235, partial [Alphaproteobacteria bacterium]|nr:hypothetical protein [Alphaproteobacteria bacterium]